MKRSSLYTFVILLAATVITASPAKAVTIDFNDLIKGTTITDQYSSLGVYFRDQLSLAGNSPGSIVSDGIGATSALEPTAFSNPIYILFSQPIYSFDLVKFEHVAQQTPTEQPPSEQPPSEQPPSEQPAEQAPSEQPPTEAPTESAPQEEYTVYFEFFKDNSGVYEKLDADMHNSVKDAWTLMGTRSTVPISAVKVYGSNYYKVDNIGFSHVVATPEPATMVLFGLGGVAMAFFRRKAS